MSVTLIFAFAAVALVIAAALWWLDARGRRDHSAVPDSAEAAREAAPEGEAEPETERRAPSRLAMPGQGRRERRAWAQEAGFDFARTDDALAQEWRRGAAASGATAHDVVTGVSEGHEFTLADLGSTTVLAVRRGAFSDVVVDFRRPDVTWDASEDLKECGEVEGFACFSTDVEAARRLNDERVSAALEVMPDFVRAVWCEANWALAQLDRGTHGHDWEAIIAPMTWLADAAHALPPRSAASLALDEALPSRLMPPPEAAPAPEQEREPEDGEQEEKEKPAVLRPEEPVRLPTRTRTQSRGVVEPRPVGGDEVPGIADRAEEPSDYRGTRVLRLNDGGPSIFDDLAEKLGRDPLEHLRGHNLPEQKEGK
ncbi:hypothetical protein V5S96_00380 [Corynebacterium mastitidis]|uniref:Secreted protein n=1 Tax=Corynebacterium mastitidis TaxID=161890 RepID=A0ABU8NUZ7_9CORY